MLCPSSLSRQNPAIRIDLSENDKEKVLSASERMFLIGCDFFNDIEKAVYNIEQLVPAT